MKCTECGESAATMYGDATRKLRTVHFFACSHLCAAMISADTASAALGLVRWRDAAPRKIRRRAALAAMTVVAMAASACAGPMASRLDGIHEALNAVTGIADPLYATTAAACDSAEALVVSRASTAEIDKADIAAIRAACDRAFAALETARQTQLAARAATELARASGETEDLAAVVRSLKLLRATVDSAKAALEAAQAVLQTSRTERT